MDSKRSNTRDRTPGELLPCRTASTRDWPLTIAVGLILGMQIVLTVAVVRLGRVVDLLVDIVTR